jgi:GT2 family glycosyltransferase
MGMIYTHIAYAPTECDGNIGCAYNKFMEILPNDDDWACFLDHDAMFTTSTWYNQLGDIIKKNKDVGAFGCRTNRIGNILQLIGNIDLMSNDIVYHRKVGSHLQKNYYNELFFPEEHLKSIGEHAKTHYSGVFILISKKTWKEINGFETEGFLRVDNDFRFRLHQKNIKFGIMNGVYVYHWYRFDDKYYEAPNAHGHLGDPPYERLEILQEIYEKQKDKLTLNDIFFYTEAWWKLKKKLK